MNVWIFGFISGVVAVLSAQFIGSWWLSRPQVPKWPKDYRKICPCIGERE